MSKISLRERVAGTALVVVGSALSLGVPVLLWMSSNSVVSYTATAERTIEGQGVSGFEELGTTPVANAGINLAELEVIRSPRIIDAISIEDVIPETGKIIIADLAHKMMFLYEDGELNAEFPIASFGRPGTPWETPAGLYSIHTKEPVHFSSIGHVYMPYSMQFFGNYFIHGWPYYPDGTLTSSLYSGGCIKLDTEDSEEVFAFADIGTKVFVYDPKTRQDLPSLSVDFSYIPRVSATSYLVADLDTGDVYAERRPNDTFQIASIAKLMTALVANELISYKRNIPVLESEIDLAEGSDQKFKYFAIGDLMYPLLMASSSVVADSIAEVIGTQTFAHWMNNEAGALSMESTTFADVSGKSSDTVSTTDDLFRLTSYLLTKKSFVFDITHRSAKNITAIDGSSYEIRNLNELADTEPFIGAKAGLATSTTDTMLSVVSFPVGNATRTIALVVLDSSNRVSDTHALASWIKEAILIESNAACLTCVTPRYRKVLFP